ncbi:cytochrome c3 family protein [Pseudomonas vancouverensis]|uniref:Class III cytochrome C family protein n=1 Tax=Pseudomonas vancouverensis TaxID=95300 RepID=A0A1H2NN83_PSEVA|nr:cytochrome c3 family protein [Pseudomonas vancouverensis]KAB0495299.1 cytochrome c3 family protein [Pseudomonas vancouverensis]TDB56940.1 class III cytochrome C family protein [Pseudomonas vancouverensis]SDV06611.1 Class III cytochrome C family protein [Pseudomonas vancouverensis]
MKCTRWPGWLILTAALGYAVVTGHAALVRERPLLPLDFNHQVHGKVSCLTCHHDYADHSPSPPSGERTCLLCHKKSPALALRIEQDFHALCRDCHLQQVRAFHPAGPVRECQRCHAPPVFSVAEPDRLVQ